LACAELINSHSSTVHPQKIFQPHRPRELNALTVSGGNATM